MICIRFSERERVEKPSNAEMTLLLPYCPVAACLREVFCVTHDEFRPRFWERTNFPPTDHESYDKQIRKNQNWICFVVTVFGFEFLWSQNELSFGITLLMAKNHSDDTNRRHYCILPWMKDSKTTFLRWLHSKEIERNYQQFSFDNEAGKFWKFEDLRGINNLHRSVFPPSLFETEHFFLPLVEASGAYLRKYENARSCGDFSGLPAMFEIIFENHPSINISPEIYKYRQFHQHLRVSQTRSCRSCFQSEPILLLDVVGQKGTEIAIKAFNNLRWSGDRSEEVQKIETAVACMAAWVRRPFWN